MTKQRTIRSIINWVIIEASKGIGKYPYNLNDQALAAIKEIRRTEVPEEINCAIWGFDYSRGANSFRQEVLRRIEESE